MNDILADWADVVDRAVPGPRSPEVLTVELDGWEGPLDLLLALARTQKVDLRELSILALVEQYLAFIENRSEEHTSELQSLMRISYAVFCLKKKKQTSITCIQIHSCHTTITH